MVWTGVSVFAKTKYEFISGRQNARNYTKTLDDHLFPFMSSKNFLERIFQKDGASIHTANHSKKWFVDRNITVLSWTSCSPDLSLIEHLWAILAWKVYADKRKLITWKT